VNESEYLQEIIFQALIKEQFWDGPDNIKEEITGKIVYRNGLNLLESSCSLDKVQDDLEKVNDINCLLDLLKCLLLLARVFLGCVNIGEWVKILVDIWEHNNKWYDEHAIDCQDGDHEVPDLAEGSLGVDEVPLEFWLILVDGAVFVGILIDVIDHHLLQVRLCHFLKSGLEPQFIVITPSFYPQLFHTLILLSCRHVLPFGFGV
jgi:hypothetical protein